MSHILIIDDEPSICWGLKELFTEQGHSVATAPSAERGLASAAERRPDAVVLDVRLPGIDGLTAISRLREHLGDAPVVVITAFGDLETAVRAVREGAFEYLVKPFDLDQAADAIRRALANRAGPDPTPAAPRSHGEEPIVGASPAMQRVFKQIALAAPSEVPVLITGESGTGKELVAQALHRHGPRSGRPLVPVCVPALNPSVIESELFGHRKGAFTGADSDRVGLLERADGGSVFLDEIGDVPLPMQVKLLRALERGEVIRVGDSLPRRADFRVIAATNRSLSTAIRAGDFREDLYYRLAVFVIELPPLRRRAEDIPVLAGHFLARAGGRASGFTDAAIDELRSRPWAGNVRELRNAVEHAAIVARGDRIGPEDLPDPLPDGEPAPATTGERLRDAVAAWATARESAALYEEFLAATEPALLRVALEVCGHNRAAAARLLGIHRATLRQKCRQHGLDE